MGEQDGGSVTASYGFGAVEGGTVNDHGAPPSAVSAATQLTASNAGDSWNAAANNSLGAWDFGTGDQPPAVKYADYDGSGTVFNCNQAPAGACDTALPGQQAPTIEELSTAFSGGEVSLAGADDDPLSVRSWHWRQLEGPLVSLTATDSRELTFTAPTIDGSVVLLFRRTDTADGRRALFPLIVKAADADGDGLIEIDDLAMLHNMRHDLTGASYKSSAASAGNSTGCPALGCTGYELVGDLDFDADGDGTSWTGDSTDGYLLDDGDSRAPYFVVDASNAGGWLPIGDSVRPFVATFEGNGYSIRNLGISSTAAQIGLFGTLGGGAAVRNLGLIGNLAEHSGTATETDIGGLAGQQSGGSLITASYATGPVQGGAGNRDVAGGLVGRQSGGSITASHATGPVDGGAGNQDVAGGLVGRQSGGSIVASHATGAVEGGAGNQDTAGGLVGLQTSGALFTASYATGAVDGGSGAEDMVGGLVGDQRQGAEITASYASGAVRGGSGAEDRVGGLVGRQGGLVRASYATGDAAGGSGDEDTVGGLAGVQRITGIILASYATGAADGGGEPLDSVGGLLGSSQGGEVTASYGVGEILGGGLLGSAGSVARPSRTLLKDLDASSPVWNVDRSRTRGAWDFGDFRQLPVLRYADYDGAGGREFDCSQFPAGACGTLLPRQALLGADGPAYLTAAPDSALIAGSASSVTLSVTAAGRLPTDSFVSWSWRQVEGVGGTLTDADTPEALFIVPDSGERLVFEVTVVDGGGDEYTDFVTLLLLPAVDRDRDGLIDIDDLTMLHNMRNNMAGTAYESETIEVANTAGCPPAGCFGYELSGNLDFDADGDGSSWTGDGAGGYRLDAGDSRAPYFVVDEHGAGGWQPIGHSSNHFTAVFDGNGYSIRNLGIRRDQDYLGLIGFTNQATVRNIGLVANLVEYTGGTSDNVQGALVGRQNDGSITTSYATGPVRGGGDTGGLVGNSDGAITASYATGPVTGGRGGADDVGGLVGASSRNVITASYATGPVDSGGGSADDVGGLVGYAFQANIVASYATGNVAHGPQDNAGALVGDDSASAFNASYGFGAVEGGGSVNSLGSPLPQGVVTVLQLTVDSADTSWNSTGRNTNNAWDFGTNQQRPLLKYGNYDGGGSTFDCNLFPANACSTLLPGQGGLTLGGPSLALFGDEVTLSAAIDARVLIDSWLWQQLEGPPVTLTDANSPEPRFAAPTGSGSLLFQLTADDGAREQYTEFFTVEIIEDHVLVSPAMVQVAEGGSALYTLKLPLPPAGAVTVQLQLMPASLAGYSFEVTPRMLAFDASDWSVAQTVTISLSEDDVDAPNQEFRIRHQVMTAGGDSRTAATDVVVQLIDNDERGIRFTRAGVETSQESVREDEGPFVYQVALRSRPTAAVVVSLTLAGDTAVAGTPAPASLTFMPAQWSETKTVSVTLIDDSNDDGLRNLDIVHTAAGGDYDSVVQTLMLEVGDDDSRPNRLFLTVEGLMIDGVTTPVGEPVVIPEGSTARMTLVATLNNAAFPMPMTLVLALGGGDASPDSAPLGTLDLDLGAEDFSVRVSPLANPAVFLSDPVEVTIPGGQSTVRVDIEIVGADDLVDEGAETFMIGGSVAGVAMPGTVTFAIGDNDERGVTVTPVGSSDIVEQDTNYVYRFTVRLRTQPTGDVTIDIDGVDISVPPGFVIDSNDSARFTPANWSMPQTVSVTFLPDDVDSADGPWTITPNATGADYAGIRIASLSGMLFDNDERGVTVIQRGSLNIVETICSRYFQYAGFTIDS